jgi:acyl dehydratase
VADSTPTRYSAWANSPTKDMSLEEYIGLLEKASGTQFNNNWAPGLLGPKFPNPGECFITSITHDAIRHYLDAVGDLNPLYRNPSYARGSSVGMAVAPPTILYGVAYGHYVDPLVVPTSPDFPNTYGGDSWEWFQPIREGDEVDWTTTMPYSVERKQTKSYGLVAFVWGRHEYRRRSDGTLLARCTFSQVVRHRDQAQARAQEWHAQDKLVYSEDDIREVHAIQDAESARGAEPRYWEDVVEGDELPPLVRGPHSMMDRVAWLIAAVGERFFVSDRIYRFMNEHSGWGTWDPEWKIFRNFHDDMFDKDYPGSFGSQRTGWSALALTNWMGDDAFLWKLKSEHRTAGGNGWIFWCKPKVTARYRVDEHCCVDIECSMEKNDGLVATRGSATVILPSREYGPVRYPDPNETANA